MKLISALKDVVNHLLIIDGIDWVRIDGTATGCTMSTEDAKPSVIVNIEMNEPIDGLIGTLGISDIAQLRQILRAPGFDIPTASTQFVADESGTNGWSGGLLHFDNGAGQNYEKSVVGKRRVEEKMIVHQLKIPVQFDTPFSPDGTGIALLKHWHDYLKKQEFKPNSVAFLNNNGDVECRYRFSSSLKYQFLFKKSAGTKFQEDWKYMTEPILAILNLYAISKSISISICDLGLLKIEVDSGLANYRYLIPALQR